MSKRKTTDIMAAYGFDSDDDDDEGDESEEEGTEEPSKKKHTIDLDILKRHGFTSKDKVHIENEVADIAPISKPLETAGLVSGPEVHRTH
jgi:hypothetical protein